MLLHSRFLFGDRSWGFGDKTATTNQADAAAAAFPEDMGPLMEALFGKRRRRRLSPSSQLGKNFGIMLKGSLSEKQQQQQVSHAAARIWAFIIRKGLGNDALYFAVDGTAELFMLLLLPTSVNSSIIAWLFGVFLCTSGRRKAVSNPLSAFGKQHPCYCCCWCNGEKEKTKDTACWPSAAATATIIPFPAKTVFFLYRICFLTPENGWWKVQKGDEKKRLREKSKKHTKNEKKNTFLLFYFFRPILSVSRNFIQLDSQRLIIFL